MGEYEDDFDDGEEEAIGPGIRAGGSDYGDDSEDGSGRSSGEDDRWAGQNRGKGGKLKGKGKGRGKSKGPVEGQTVQARRKEENKSAVANHNRRDRAWAKM